VFGLLFISKIRQIIIAEIRQLVIAEIRQLIIVVCAAWRIRDKSNFFIG